jgi:hypothetical protein
MKKILIALGLVALASVASAQDSVVQLGYKYQDTNSNYGANAQGYNFLLGTNVNKNLGVDVYSESLFTENNGANSTRLEAGLTPSTTIGATGLSVYSRVAVGQKFIPGNNFTYWSVEPGVKYALSEKLTAKASFRFRNAFDTANNDTSRTETAGLEYALTKTSYIGGFVAHVSGDSTQNGNQVMATYGVKF